MEYKPQVFTLLKHIKETMDKEGNSILKDSNITMAQGMLLYCLSCKTDEECTLKELESHIKLAQSTTTVMVSRLEKNGFVTTFNSSEDKRVKLVKLTDKGQESVSLVKECMINVEQEIFAPLSEIEKSLFLELIKKINHSFS